MPEAVVAPDEICARQAVHSVPPVDYCSAMQPPTESSVAPSDSNDSPTPEAAVPAPLGRRFLAFAYDYSLWAASWMALLVGLAVPGVENAWLAKAFMGLGVVGLVAFVAVSLVWLHRFGQSLGKRAYGLAARSLNGQRVSLWRLVFLRNVAFMGMQTVPLFGPVLTLVDYALGLRSDRRCLHDIVAGTHVVTIEDSPTTQPGGVIRTGTVLWTIVSISLAVTLFSPLKVGGPSNEPTLLHDESFMTIRPLPYVGPHVAVGDVVTFVSPADGGTIVKRVYAMPGDSIEIRNGWIVRNQAPLPRRDAGPCVGFIREDSTCRMFHTELGRHRFRVATTPGDYPTAAVTIPSEHVYVLGDHLDHSNDSRNLGPVPINGIIGIATTIYWSADDRGQRWNRMLTPIP